MDDTTDPDRTFASDDYPEEIKAVYRTEDAAIVSTGPAKWLLRYDGEDVAWGRGFGTFVPKGGVELHLGERLPPEEMPTGEDERLPTAIVVRAGGEEWGTGAATGRVWLAEDPGTGLVDTIEVDPGEWYYWFVDDGGRFLGEGVDSAIDADADTGDAEDDVRRIQRRALERLEEIDRDPLDQLTPTVPADDGPTRIPSTFSTDSNATASQNIDFSAEDTDLAHVAEREPTEYEERRGLHEDIFQVLGGHVQNGRFVGYLVSGFGSDSRSWVSRSRTIETAVSVVLEGEVVEIDWDVVADVHGTVNVEGEDFEVWGEEWSADDPPHGTGGDAPVPLLSIGNWIEACHVYEDGHTWTREATDEVETDTETIDWWALL